MTYFPLHQTTCFFIPLVAPCTPLLSLLEKQPDITCLEIIETLNLSVSIDTAWRFLQKAGYRRKKKSLHASEQERPRCGKEEEKLERPYVWIQGK